MKRSWQMLLNLSLIFVFFWFLIQLPVQAKSEINYEFQSSKLFYRGIENINNQNYQQAISNFTQVIKQKSSLVAAAYSNRCLVYLQLGNNQAAKSDCSAAVKLNPDNTEAYLNLGLTEYRLGNYDEALEQYQQVIQRNKDDYRVYYNQGLAHFAQQNYEKSLTSYEQALLLNSFSFSGERALIYSDKGLVNLMLGNFPNAIADLTKAISLDSSNERFYYNRACAHHKNGDYQAAIADFSQVLQLNPQSAQAYVNRGLLQHQIGLEYPAIKDLNTALYYFEKQKQMIAYQETINLIKRLQKTLAQSSRPQFS
jgi:tetratricopeptide (TPR) repeat protein